MTLFWTVLLVLSVVVETFTTSLVAVWFIPGEILAIIFAAVKFPLWTQILAFCISGLGILFRVALREKLFKTKVVLTNSDALIGKRAVVIEEICNVEARGAAKVGAAVWTARSADGGVIPAESVVEIVAIEGVKLICKTVN